MAEKNFDGTFDHELLESVFRTSKKVIQEYVREIDRTNRYRSVRSSVVRGTVLDDRGPLIDLYEACLQQDAHIRAVLETLVSQILGDRYMLARQNEKGKYIKDVEQTRKVQGTQFDKIIRGHRGGFCFELNAASSRRSSMVTRCWRSCPARTPARDAFGR